jgi:hypothetical protein
MTDSVATNSTPLSDVAQALGAQDFEPWEGEFDAKLFSETMENHRVNGHMALAVMHQTKEKIMDGFRQLPEPMATMTDAISDSVDGLRAIADAMDAARLRLLSACVAVHS